MRLFAPPSLAELAETFGTDKNAQHRYAQHYARHFGPLRQQPLTLLEIGIGGYHDVRAGGHSLRMWKAYFPKAQIVGIDCYNKKPLEEPRITTFRGSQTDEAFLHRVIAQIGTPQIIIDDGSHKSPDVIATFECLFPLLDGHGLYVIEDLQTSYWTQAAGIDWGGSEDLEAPHTSMNYLKRLVDGLHYEEFNDKHKRVTPFDASIIGLHFYHNLLFIEKGRNQEGSINVLRK